ncbi:sugar transferase [Flavobacterium sp. RHBU_24]|uniref:sugar transferase n=1 Tax=Flavobacterium sp. RHBU_24 TaxID=3391185 RepID=UPI0039854FD3
MAKRMFDFVLALAGIILTGWLMLLFFIITSIDTGQTGLFMQRRIGRFGKKFTIYKLRTMKDTARGKYVSQLGRFMRRWKIDELPQLFNILAGSMSFVGPRPDVPGYYDLLQGDNRKLLMMRPGLTGPASLKYANEEALLALAKDPAHLNDNVIFPDKVRINRAYQEHANLWLDIKIIAYTLLGKLPTEDYFQ